MLCGQCRGKESCPAAGKQFQTCQETGHFTRSILCPKKKLMTKKLEAVGESESAESLGRIQDQEVIYVGKVQNEGATGIRVTLAAVACCKEFTGPRF